MQADNWVSVIEAERSEVTAIDSWSWELDFNHWRCSWIFRISTDRDLKYHGMNSALVGSDWMVSIVWLQKTFKNYVSLLVSKNRSQKLINSSDLNIGVHLCFVFDCNCICTVGLISPNYATIELFFINHINQPLRPVRIWHKINFLSGV